MDQVSHSCPHCGAVHDNVEQLCHICRSPLNVRIEQYALLSGHSSAQGRQQVQRQESPQPRYSRRRLIVGLVLGGLGLAGIGICVPALRGILTKPHHLPVDPHRMLNLPLQRGLGQYMWLPDNTHILGYTYSALFLLDVKSGLIVWERKTSFHPQGRLGEIRWSSDRRYVAEVGNVGSGSSDEFSAVVWDLQSRQIIWHAPPLGHLGNTFFPCAFAPNGTYFALCVNNDNDTSNVQIWDVQHNRLLNAWSVQNHAPISPGQAANFNVTTMAWSPDNTRLALICDGGSVQVWHAASGRRLWTYEVANGRGASLQWSPDGTSLALQLYLTTMPVLNVLDAHTGKLRFQTFWVSLQDRDAHPTTSVVWSNDGTRLALVAYEDSAYVVQVWDVRAGQRLFTCQHVQAEQAICLSWSPDGRYLVAGKVISGVVSEEYQGEDATLQFWDAQNGKRLFSYQAPRSPGQLAWSPDSHFLATYNPQGFERTGIHYSYENFALQVFQVA